MPQRLVIHGPRARRLRKEAKLTQEQAAVQAGLTASTLRRIENGKESVQLSTLGKLADAYDADPCALLRRVP
jgi:transcriptional regulator with XRE-family HTH domain